MLALLIRTADANRCHKRRADDACRHSGGYPSSPAIPTLAAEGTSSDGTIHRYAKRAHHLKRNSPQICLPASGMSSEIGYGPLEGSLALPSKTFLMVIPKSVPIKVDKKLPLLDGNHGSTGET
jgi:hypothetical protein